jgi:hypothetical protein
MQTSSTGHVNRFVIFDERGSGPESGGDVAVCPQGLMST